MARLILAFAALCLSSCHEAQDTAQLLDKEAVCVGAYPSYCMIKGKPFICDDHRCLPFCSSAAINLFKAESSDE